MQLSRLQPSLLLAIGMGLLCGCGGDDVWSGLHPNAGRADYPSSSTIEGISSVDVAGIGEISVEEEYIPRVVWCEIQGEPPHPALLRAQAIAARSFMYYRHSCGFTSMRNSTDDQVYKLERCSGPIPEEYMAAARDTAGVVMVKPEGRLHHGYYRAGSQRSCEFFRYCFGEPCMGQREASACAESGYDTTDILGLFYVDLRLERAIGSYVVPPPEDPSAEDLPEDPPAEDPPEDPPAEDPAAEDPAAEDPAAEDPPAEDPHIDGHPQVRISSRLESIPSQAADLCLLEGSQVFDWWVGQETEAIVDVTNSGQADANNTQVAIAVARPFLQVKSWTIVTDHGTGAASFSSAGDDAVQAVPQYDPGASFVLMLRDIRPGETKRIRLKLAAESASFGLVEPPQLRAWVLNIDGYYSKKLYDGAYDNRDGLQGHNAGNLRCSTSSTIIEPETCDGVDNDCNGIVDDACSGDDPAAPGDPAVPEPPAAPEPPETYYPEPEHPEDQPENPPLGAESRRTEGVFGNGGCSMVVGTAGSVAGILRSPLPLLLLLGALWRSAGRQRRKG